MLAIRLLLSYEFLVRATIYIYKQLDIIAYATSNHVTHNLLIVVPKSEGLSSVCGDMQFKAESTILTIQGHLMSIRVS